MNLKKKKRLAARALGVGVGRVIIRRIDEINEAITKQDIRDLFASGAIAVKDIKGKRKKERSGGTGFGKIKKKIRNRKENYLKLTRKLRGYLKQLRMQGRVNDKDYAKIRKQIKSKMFRSKAHMNEVTAPKPRVQTVKRRGEAKK
jgi:large subunit ribosomal protein L19e